MITCFCNCQESVWYYRGNRFRLNLIPFNIYCSHIIFLISENLLINIVINCIINIDLLWNWLTPYVISKFMYIIVDAKYIVLLRCKAGTIIKIRDVTWPFYLRKFRFNFSRTYCHYCVDSVYTDKILSSGYFVLLDWGGGQGQSETRG